MSSGGQPGSDPYSTGSSASSPTDRQRSDDSSIDSADPAVSAAEFPCVKIAYKIPPVPVLVLAASPGSGKTRLLEQWASQVPDGQRWTFITRGETVRRGVHTLEGLSRPLGADHGADPRSGHGADEPELPPRSDGAHVIHLAHDCACCNGRMVLKTHLARTLRMRRPDRLFIEAFLDDHLPKTLAWLAGAEWEGWLTQVRCMALLPLLPTQTDTAISESALLCADVLSFVTPQARTSQQAQGAASTPSTISDAARAAQRLLQARQIGGPDQWRINAPLEKLDWGVIEQTLGTARRRI